MAAVRRRSYAGQSWDVEVDFPGDAIDSSVIAELVDRFEAEHHRTYGVRDDAGSPVVIGALRLAVIGPAAEVASLEPEAAGLAGRPARRAAVARDEYDTTVVVPAGWSVRRDATGTLVLERRITADEMATTIFPTGHSTVIRDVMDFRPRSAA